MKSLKELLNENISHLRNLYILIDEKLNELVNTKHSSSREYHQSSKYITKNIDKTEIIDLINKCDNQIVNNCLNKKLNINDEFGLLKKEYNGRNEYLSIILKLKYFNKENLNYDLIVITNNRTSHEYKFKEVIFYCNVNKDGRVETIYL